MNMSVIKVEYTKFKVQFSALSLFLPVLNSVNLCFDLFSLLLADRTDGHYIIVQELGVYSCRNITWSFPSYDFGKMILGKVIRFFVYEILILFCLPEMALQYYLSLCKQPTLKSQLMIKYCHISGAEDYTIRIQKSIVSTAYTTLLQPFTYLLIQSFILWSCILWKIYQHTLLYCCYF